MSGRGDWALEVLGHYRDRTIRVLSEVRAIGCVTDECGDLVGDSYEINTSISEVVEALASVLGTLQAAIDKAATEK